MTMRTQIFAKNYGYGKLLFKTTSIQPDWDIRRIAIATETPQYTVLDNVNDNIIKQDILTGLYYSINADLSLGSGDYSVFLNLEDFSLITQFYSYKHISWLDMSLLDNIYILYLYNSNQSIQVDGSLDALKYFQVKNADLIGFDFSGTTEMVKFKNIGVVTTDIPLVIEQNKKMISFRLDTNMQLASFDTTGMNDLTDFNVKINPITSINLDNLTSIITFYLQSCNDVSTFIQTQINSNLKTINIWGNSLGINNFNISLYPNLVTAYLRSIHLQNITIDNPKLETLYLSYNELTDLVISNNTTAIKYLHIYSNGSLNTLTKPHLPNLTYANIGGYNNIQEFDFSGSPLFNTLVCNHASFRKVNLKNGNTNAIISLLHTYYADCCFLVDDENDPVIAGWDLRDGDVVTSDQATYDAF